MWWVQAGSGSGKSRRVWTPRDSSRAAAAAIIRRATVACSAGPAGGVVEDVAEDVAAPEVDLLGGLGQARGVAGDADGPPHQARSEFADVGQVERLVAVAGGRGRDRRDFEAVAGRRRRGRAAMSSAARAP